MAGTDIILKLEIVDGRTPDAENVANALLAWIDLLKTAGAIIDPEAELLVGLTGVEHGSNIFKLSMTRLETFAGQMKDGASEYPLVSKAAIGLAGMIGASVIGVAVAGILEPDPRIPDDQMAVFEEQRELLRESVELQRQQNRFFGILHDEPAIESIDVLRPDRTKYYSIPREDFAARSGLWTGGPESAVDQQGSEARTVLWDVILIRPVLIDAQRRWVFVRDGLEFSARMADKAFLQAISAKTLPIPLAEGIRMRIEVKYRETYDGSVWLPVKGSHRVTRVLEPLPPASPSPLFPYAGSPKE